MISWQTFICSIASGLGGYVSGKKAAHQEIEEQRKTQELDELRKEIADLKDRMNQ
jgi:hypothetical protein